MIKKTTTSGLNIFIRPETTDEHEEVNELIYKAFAESYDVNTGTFMIEHFKEERKKERYLYTRAFSYRFIGKWKNCRASNAV